MNGPRKEAVAARTRTRPWDPADYLEDEGDVVAYLEAAFEDGDPGGSARGRGPFQGNDRRRGEVRIGQGEPVQGAFARREPGFYNRAERPASPWPAPSSIGDRPGIGGAGPPWRNRMERRVRSSTSRPLRAER